MSPVVSVAGDVVREAASRKWFLFLGGAITLTLACLALGLKMDVVDGALAATRLFGKTVSNDVVPVDVVLRPVFEAVSYVVYYGGIAFGLFACADFGPNLLSPGRIEHLLSLPVLRWQLLLGTYLGVLALAALSALYGAGGLAVILGLKTGVWTARPVLAALLACVSYAGIYAAMLSAAVFVRSAAFAQVVGGTVFVLGILASYRTHLSSLFESGWARWTFEAALAPLPRIGTLAEVSGALAGHRPVLLSSLGTLLAGLAAFAGGALVLGIWRFEGKDF